MAKSEEAFLRDAAWRYLLKEQLDGLPINVFELAVSSGYLLYTYWKYAEVIKKPVEYLIEKYDNDGFVFWSVRHKSFVICFNDALPPDVVRWTVMHEIAHIILEHVTPDAPALTRVRKIEHPHIEREADGFARRVLYPSIVLHDCGAIEVTDIMRLCGISRQAAEYRSDYMKILEARGMFKTAPLERAVERQFKPFIAKYLLDKYKYEFAAEIAA